MTKQMHCVTVESFKRLAAFEKFEATALKGAPYRVLMAVDKAWDAEQEIFEISIPNSKAGAALKLQNVLDSDGKSEDPAPFSPALMASLRKLKKLLESGGTRRQLQGRAKTVRALLQEADKSYLTGMVLIVLAAIEHDYSEFGEQAAGVRGAKMRASKAGSKIAA